MSSQERDTVLLKEMLDLIELTIRHVPKDKNKFLNDVNARDATALCGQAIGDDFASFRAYIQQIIKLP